MEERTGLTIHGCFEQFEAIQVHLYHVPAPKGQI